MNQNTKLFSILAYLGILWLIPLLAAKDDEVAMFHTNQGLVLFLADLVCGVVCGIITVIPFMGFIGFILSGVISVAGLVLMIMGIVNAANGEMKELPIIGKIRIIK